MSLFQSSIWIKLVKKFITSKKLYTVIGILVFLLLWQIISLFIKDNIFIFPGPIDTLKQVVTMLESRYVYECILNTISRMLVGYLISFVLAFILGVLAGNFEKLEYIFKPTISVFKSIPTACLVYLFLIVVGAKMTPLMIVILVAFPILYENICAGIKATPIEIINAYKLDNTSFFDSNIKIRIPLAKNHIKTGFNSSFGLALKIEIMAEVITGYTRLGLGSAILAAQRSDPSNMLPIFAYGLIAIVLMLIVDVITNIISK